MTEKTCTYIFIGALVALFGILITISVDCSKRGGVMMRTMWGEYKCVVTK